MSIFILGVAFPTAYAQRSKTTTDTSIQTQNLGRLKVRLQLTDEQVQRLKLAFRQYFKYKRRLMKNDSLSVAEKMNQLDKLTSLSQNSYKTSLTPVQVQRLRDSSLNTEQWKLQREELREVIFKHRQEMEHPLKGGKLRQTIVQ